MKRILTALAMAVLVGACANTVGTGTATSLSGDVGATFVWEDRGHEGTMTATLSAGETYTGQFFQVTRDTRIDTLSPLWDGWPYSRWNFPWGRWNYWGPDVRFVTVYSGRVVANLAGPDGTHMRCRFFLRHPNTGMAGGGQGTCQLPDGRNIDATFP